MKKKTLYATARTHGLPIQTVMVTNGTEFRDYRPRTLVITNYVPREVPDMPGWFDCRFQIKTGLQTEITLGGKTTRPYRDFDFSSLNLSEFTVQ